MCFFFFKRRHRGRLMLALFQGYPPKMFRTAPEKSDEVDEV